MYLSGTYNTDAVKIVVGQDSVVDLINNREFLRLSHTVGQYCNNTFLAGDSPACKSGSNAARIRPTKALQIGSWLPMKPGRLPKPT